MTQTVDSESLLRIEHVDKWYGDFHVLSDVSLEVDRGQVICIIGPSGSGKSTLLRCLNNLEEIQGGRIYLHDDLIGIEPYKNGFAKLSSKDAARQRLKFGFVFQQFQLFPNMTVLENVTVGPIRVKGESRASATQRGRELLEKVGLSDRADSYPSGISGGQQQRVGIARALAMEPEVLLFDEPTSALDPELVGEVLRTIRDLAEQGYTMMIVTHQLEFARQVADRVAFFDQGSIVEHGSPAQVLDSPADPRTQKFLSAVETEV